MIKTTTEPTTEYWLQYYCEESGVYKDALFNPSLKEKSAYKALADSRYRHPHRRWRVVKKTISIEVLDD